MIVAEKENIIRQMYEELEATKEADRFFTIDNIKNCASDLDRYLDLLSEIQESNRKQKEISKCVKWIFQSLSKFENEYEEPEFLWGFIYNGYTKELTDLILKSAFLFGLERKKPKIIKSNVFHLKYTPHSSDIFRIYIGSTGNSGVVLEINPRTFCFEYAENPYGESYGLPIFDLKSNPDFSELSFDVLSSGSYKTITLKAQKEIDKVLFKAILRFHKNNTFSQQPPPDFCAIELELNEGAFQRLHITNYDHKNHLIPMFNTGTGLMFFVQEFDRMGRFQNSENLAPHPEIVAEKFVVIDAVPEWKYYDIDAIEMKGHTIFVRTKKKLFQYKDEIRSEVVSFDMESKTLSCEIKAHDLIRELLGELLLLRTPFKSKFKE